MLCHTASTNVTLKLFFPNTKNKKDISITHHGGNSRYGFYSNHIKKTLKVLEQFDLR